MIDPNNLRKLCGRIAQTPPALPHRVAGRNRLSWSLIRWRALRTGNWRIARALWVDSRGRIGNFHDLKIVTSLLSLTEDHALYEACLRRYDAGIVLPDASWRRRFHGEGVGSDSLNVYRILEGPDGTSFEKTYRSDSSSITLLPFIHDTVLPRIDGVRAPRIEAVDRSDRLTIMCFDAVPMADRSKVSLAYIAHTIRMLAQGDLTGLEIPPPMRDFGRFHFRKFAGRLRDRIRRDYPEQSEEILDALKRCEQEIRSLPVVLCHGDLNKQNFSADGHVIDWDLAGFFPYGYDAAYVAGMMQSYRGLPALRAFYAAHFARAQGDPGDETAFLFFFLHFMQKFPRQSRNDRLFHQILKALALLPARRRPRAAARYARPSRSEPSHRASTAPG